MLISLHVSDYWCRHLLVLYSVADYFSTWEYFIHSFFKGLAPSAPTVMHPGIPLQTGTGPFGCSDSFQQALILCPPTIQGIDYFLFSLKTWPKLNWLNRWMHFPSRNPHQSSKIIRILCSNGGFCASSHSSSPHSAPPNQTWSHHTGKIVARIKMRAEDIEAIMLRDALLLRGGLENTSDRQ